MTEMVFFTAQCKFVTTMDSVCKEAVENPIWTNKVGTITSTRSQTVLKSICLVNETNKCEASDQKITPHKSKAIASFDPTNNIAKNFFLWLTGSGGGCRSYWEAQPIISKCLKFLQFFARTKRSSHLTWWTLVYVYWISFLSLLIQCRMIRTLDMQDTNKHLPKTPEEFKTKIVLHW